MSAQHPSAPPLLSVIVPVFNEAANLRGNLGLLFSELKPLASPSGSIEVIAVNDGSRDDTAQVLSDVQNKLRGSDTSLIRFETLNLAHNSGKGSAVRAGFRQARGRHILFIDGGMELHPKEIGTFLDILRSESADIVIGSKRHPASVVVYPWYRKILSRLYQLLIRALFRINVTDTQVGLKLFRREVIDAVLPSLSIDRYGFDLELLALARHHGFTRIKEAPVRLDYFDRQTRALLPDLLHVLKVGFLVVGDTLALYRKLRRDAR